MKKENAHLVYIFGYIFAYLIVAILCIGGLILALSKEFP